ncbi:ATP-binding protein [Clostridium sp. AL.422]|uniref:sensor histidine kinase n=1 Tax=Clostridium TaxID=1485 RepID=UPI00293DE058|nr:MULTISPECIES: ATP-binding protein [unclassified Clostridium]MDV4149589.1 ATP-binding protein [Clostridium sp. AL.422]
MRNRRLYKFIFNSMLDILISISLTFLTFITIKLILDYLYRKDNIPIVRLIWYYWRELKGRLFGDYIYAVIGIVLFFVFYILIIYRKTKNLVEVINETEEMSNGNLTKIIKTEAKGDIKILADNINNISSQLKNLTIEERRAQQTKNDLITNVSHDLRTPLTSIIGYLEIIDTDKYKDEVQLRYYVNIAYEKAKSLSILINDLFELTKMQNKAIKLDRIDINLVELLGQVVAQFEYQFNSADMKSRINFSEDRLMVNADPGKLVRVFENLLSNAINYGKDGYYVDIVTKIEQDKAVVQIINYGESISSIDLPFIFDRFYRVEKSRNRSIGGSGLGLAITKSIVELHEGTISAYSDDTKTFFEVRLPII